MELPNGRGRRGGMAMKPPGIFIDMSFIPFNANTPQTIFSFKDYSILLPTTWEVYPFSDTH